MNKHIFPLLLSSLLITSVAFAQQVVTLKDGSQIKGELANIQNGVYTVKTPIIGDVHIAVSDVMSINNAASAPSANAANNQTIAPAPANAPPNADLNQEIAVRQQELINNPQAMAELQELVKDPEITQMLSDPNLVRAVTSHDVNAVQNNPTTKQLMNNSKMRALMERLQAQKASSK